jgi:hypothetical protein
MFVFINSVKPTITSCSVSTPPEHVCSCSVPTLFSEIKDTDYTRAARVSKQNAHGGFTLRSLQLLDYAMPDLEAQAPIIISVTPQVLLASHVSLTVMGSPFTADVSCSALFLDGSVSTTCTAVSAVEIVVTLHANAPAARPSMLAAVLHNERTFRAPANCIRPYFVTGLNGLCLPGAPSAPACSMSSSFVVNSSVVAVFNSSTDCALLTLLPTAARTLFPYQLYPSEGEEGEDTMAAAAAAGEVLCFVPYLFLPVSS